MNRRLRADGSSCILWRRCLLRATSMKKRIDSISPIQDVRPVSPIFRKRTMGDTGWTFRSRSPSARSRPRSPWERLGTEPRLLHAVDEDGRHSMLPKVIQVSDLPLGRHDADRLGRVRQRRLLAPLRLLVRASGLAWRLPNRSLAARLTSQVAQRPGEATRLCLRRRQTHVPAPHRFARTAISRFPVRSEQVSTGSRKHRSDAPMLRCYVVLLFEEICVNP